MEAALVQAGIGAAGSALIGLALYGAQNIYKFTKAKYSYVKHMSKNYAKLEVELKALCAIEEKEYSRLSQKRRKMKLTVLGESWLKEVKKIKDEVEPLKIDYQNQSARKFLLGIYPAPQSVKLGKRIVEKTREIVYLKSQIKDIPIMVEEAPTSILGKFWKFFRN